LAAVRYWDGKRIDLDAAVVMPDHVHALFRIVDGSLLENILRSVKSYSGRAINKLMSRQGPVWQDESFDHIVRDEASWENKMEYIQQNPVRKGLVGSSDQYP
jgi:REP element-mobilizing transposase RayT